MLNEIPTQSRQSRAVWFAAARLSRVRPLRFSIDPCASRSALLLLSLLAATPARADLHITRDHGGYVEEYKAKYARIRDRDERVIIDGICNSACTLVFGIVPMNKICVTPRASLGFHQAYYDKAFTFGIKVTSAEGTSDLMFYYPVTVKDWIRAMAGSTTEMKKIKNGKGLWKIATPSGRLLIVQATSIDPDMTKMQRLRRGRGNRAVLRPGPAGCSGCSISTP